MCLLNKLRSKQLISMGNRAVSAKDADILCAKITLGALKEWCVVGMVHLRLQGCSGLQLFQSMQKLREMFPCDRVSKIMFCEQFTSVCLCPQKSSCCAMKQVQRGGKSVKSQSLLVVPSGIKGVIMEQFSKHDSDLCLRFLNTNCRQACGKNTISQNGINATVPKFVSLIDCQAMSSCEPPLQPSKSGVHQAQSVFEAGIFKIAVADQHPQILG
jgi:hypothetical protein